MAVKNLTSKNFDEFILNGKSVVDFHADWCGPCRILSPIVEKISNETNDAKFGKIDVDKESELAQRFQVMSIPTLIFFKDGGQVDRIIGISQKEEIKNRIKKISK